MLNNLRFAAYNPKTNRMELVLPPYTYIDEKGAHMVSEKPITGIKIGQDKKDKA